MLVICNYNDPFNLPSEFPNNFDYGLEIGKKYIVMGIALYKNTNNLYYLVDENGKPNWFPYQLFEIIDNSLPQNWFVQINGDIEDSDIYSLWGFNELCNDKNYYDQLINRNKQAMVIYLQRKNEIENEYS